MFFQIDGAIDMVEKKIDYLRKPWTIPFPKIPFPSKSDVYAELHPWISQNLSKITRLAKQKISEIS